MELFRGRKKLILLLLLLLVIMFTSTPVVAPYLFMGVVIIFMADLFLIKQKEKKERDVTYERAKKDKLERDLKAWKSLGTSKNFPTPKDDSEKNVVIKLNTRKG